MAGYPAVLRQRLETIAAALPGAGTTKLPSSLDELLVHVAGLARAASDSRSAWLLFTALAGCFPDSDEVLDLRRRLELSRSDAEAATEALASTCAAASSRGVASRPIRLVRDAVIVDVNFCAKYEHNTGIQRLVRETVSRWAAVGHDIELVAWDHEVVFRALHPRETERVLHFGAAGRNREETEENGQVDLVVPVNATVVVAEVPRESVCAQLAALAEYSGSRVCVVGYDAIPLVSADLVPALESERFARYLSFVKHSDLVLAISAASAEEFSGFATSVKAQGLPGPGVVQVSLPVDLPEGEPAPGASGGIPLLVSVGSHEPRKNQEATLFAAETLWREGLEFRLVFVGRGNGELTGPFDRRLAALRKEGFPVEARRSASDRELSELYHSATVTVFPSIHEGYGLPVAESLAAGTPVITTGYGSTAEIGADGGCILVDPRDDGSLVDAFRAVITQPDVVADLRTQIAARTHRTWANYSDELWAGIRA
jgi:glycosyltransferase involved in cell wall biosynthesis